MENYEHGADGDRTLTFSKMPGSIFPASEDQQYAFLAYSWTSGKIEKMGVGGISEAPKLSLI